LAAGFARRHYVISDAENPAQLKQFGEQPALSRDSLLRSETPKLMPSQDTQKPQNLTHKTINK
jgi:hypothetical protein